MLSNNTKTISKKQLITFRVANAILIFGSIAGGLSQVLHAEAQITAFKNLGMPLYMLSIIGIAKIIGAIVLIVPKSLPLLKICAYAGIFFVVIGAFFSHVICGEYILSVSPFIVGVLAIVACVLNPSYSVIRHNSIAKG